MKGSRGVGQLIAVICVSERRIGAGKDVTSDVSWVLTADPSPSASSFERAVFERYDVSSKLQENDAA